MLVCTDEVPLPVHSLRAPSGLGSHCVLLLLPSPLHTPQLVILSLSFGPRLISLLPFSSLVYVYEFQVANANVSLVANIS